MSFFKKDDEKSKSMECVYAGPDFFNPHLSDQPEDPDDPINVAEYPQNHAAVNVPPVNAMQATYASPDAMNGKPLGAFAPPPQSDDTAGKKRCSVCGYYENEKSKFCTNCGNVFKTDDSFPPASEPMKCVYAAPPIIKDK